MDESNEKETPNVENKSIEENPINAEIEQKHEDISEGISSSEPSSIKATEETQCKDGINITEKVNEINKVENTEEIKNDEISNENAEKIKIDETSNKNAEEIKKDEIINEKVNDDITNATNTDENLKQTKSDETAKDSESVNNENTDTNFDPKNVEYIGDVAVYTDPQSGYKYKWDSDKNEWVNFTDAIYSFEGDTHVYTSSDGSKYFWDKERNGWFPKVEEDFMAQYQMNYGFTQPTVEPPKIEKPEPPKPVDKGIKRKASEPTWFEQDEKQNTKVYVSNLPLDITEEEFVDIMQKCGIIMRDPASNKLKIKMYSDPESKSFKGDALCTYIRVESVDLALNILDGYELRGKKIHVERAKFQMRGNYDPKLKPKSKRRKDKDKLKKMQQKLFDWRPEKQRGERAKHERIVIIKNMFDPKVFDDDVGLILEFKNDLNEECSKCGEVRKVTIFDRHPEGVAQVNMADPEGADAVVVLLNGRWFGKRQLSAEIWDGRTKYRIAETDSQITQRLDNWDKFLEGDEEKKKAEGEKKKMEGEKMKTEGEKNKMDGEKKKAEEEKEIV